MTPRHIFIACSTFLLGTISCQMLLHSNKKADTAYVPQQYSYGNPVQAFNQNYARIQVINTYLSDPDTDGTTAQNLKQERVTLQNQMHQIVSQTPMENYTDNMRPYISTANTGN